MVKGWNFKCSACGNKSRSENGKLVAGHCPSPRRVYDGASNSYYTLACPLVPRLTLRTALRVTLMDRIKRLFQ